MVDVASALDILGLGLGFSLGSRRLATSFA